MNDETALHLAVQRNEFSSVQHLCTLNPESAAMANQNGETPLIMAINCSSGINFELISFLSRNNPETLKIADCQGNTALHLAAKGSELRLVQHLDELCPEASAMRNKEGKTPLLMALGHDNPWRLSVEIVNFLSRRNPETLKFSDCQGNTALHLAVKSGMLDLVQNVHKLYPEAAAVQNKKGETPLLMKIGTQVTYSSISWPSFAIVTFLARENPETLKIRDHFGNTALHWAAKSGELSLVKDLYELCPEVDAIQNEDGKIPLLIGIDSGFSKSSFEIVSFLSRRNPETLKIRDHRGNTALHRAAKSGNLSLVQELLEILPQAVAIQNEKGKIPLLVGIESGFLNSKKNEMPFLLDTDSSFLKPAFLIASLLSRGNPETLKIADHRGNTALHRAAKSNKLRLVQDLYDVCPEAAAMQNKTGQTPLLVAVGHGNPWRISVDIVRILSHHGPDTVKIRDYQGNTALHWAVKSGDLRPVKALHGLYPEASAMQNDEGNTPLLVGLRTGFLVPSLGVISFLLSHRNSDEVLKIKDCDGNTALHLAVKTGNSDLVQNIYELFPEAAESHNAYCETVLHLALSGSALSNSLWPYLFDFVNSILRRNREILKVQETIRGDTILHRAIRIDKRLAEFIYELYPTATCVANSHGETPLLAFMAVFGANLRTMYDTEDLDNTAYLGVITPITMPRNLIGHQ